MIATKIHRKHLYTPLRYPGGKTSLFDFFNNVIHGHGWQNVTYIEPYAGGAGAGISLLILGKVSRIVINDYDPAIYAFWQSVIKYPKELIRKIENTPLSIGEWKKQKEIYKSKNVKDVLELGFAAFYLNRTNRSGVLNAGPIGGMGQAGKWKIDARFDRENLIERVALIAAHSNRITVLNKDGIDVIRDYASLKDAFFYIDPPYYTKGAMLYFNSFNHDKHQELADVLNSFKDVKWLLSYDANNAIKNMYIPRGRKFEVFSLRYSVHENTKFGSELMIFSDVINPAFNKLLT